jgi:hypothetical protein
MWVPQMLYIYMAWINDKNSTDFKSVGILILGQKPQKGVRALLGVK